MYYWFLQDTTIGFFKILRLVSSRYYDWFLQDTTIGFLKGMYINT